MDRIDELLQEMRSCVSDMEDEKIMAVAGEYLALGGDPYQGVIQALLPGMEKAGELFEIGEYYVPELLICGDAMNNGLEVFRPLLQEGNAGPGIPVVIGVAKGDIHDIGKNLVKTMLEAAGFQVTDLGTDVEPEEFVRAVRDTRAELVCVSTLMTPAMEEMRRTVELIRHTDFGHPVTTLVGGAPVSPSFAGRIGADGYGNNAIEAVRCAKELLNGNER